VRKWRIVAGLLHKDRIAASIGLVFSLLMAQKVVSFARGIIFARLLGTEQYGIYTLGFFFILIMVSITGLGITASFGRSTLREQGSPQMVLPESLCSQYLTGPCGRRRGIPAALGLLATYL
jgi:hypothetical protein